MGEKGGIGYFKKKSLHHFRLQDQVWLYKNGDAATESAWTVPGELPNSESWEDANASQLTLAIMKVSQMGLLGKQPHFGLTCNFFKSIKLMASIRHRASC